ncbi:MAG TPA: outer membrane beta-barrel protein [Pseudoxanthomonas sp.]
MDAKRNDPALRRATRAALYLALAAALPGTAHAVKLDYELGASLLHSDNIDLRENDPVGESVLMPQVRFNAEQTGAVVQMNLSGNLQYLSYLDNTFDDEARGDFNGRFKWDVLPERISLVAEDYLSLQPVNTQASFGPDNQQQVNIFIAGPSFHARFNPVTRGELDLRYYNTYAEETDGFDGDRYSAAARLRRQINSISQVSLNLEATKAEYDDFGGLFDYTRYDGYLNYERTLASARLEVNLGHSRIERSDDSSVSEPFFDANLYWDATSRSRFNVNLNYQLADATQDLVRRANQPDDGPITGDPIELDLQVGPDIYLGRGVRLGYRYTGERITMTLQPSFERIRYVDGFSEDQRTRSARFNLRYRLTTRLIASFMATKRVREFEVSDREDDDLVAGIGLINQFTRHWTGRIDFKRRERDSNVVGRSYRENSIALTFTYRR